MHRSAETEPAAPVIICLDDSADILDTTENDASVDASASVLPGKPGMFQSVINTAASQLGFTRGMRNGLLSAFMSQQEAVSELPFGGAEKRATRSKARRTTSEGL